MVYAELRTAKIPEKLDKTKFFNFFQGVENLKPGFKFFKKIDNSILELKNQTDFTFYHSIISRQNKQKIAGSNPYKELNDKSEVSAWRVKNRLINQNLIVKNRNKSFVWMVNSQKNPLEKQYFLNQDFLKMYDKTQESFYSMKFFLTVLLNPGVTNSVSQLNKILKISKSVASFLLKIYRTFKFKYNDLRQKLIYNEENFKRNKQKNKGVFKVENRFSDEKQRFSDVNIISSTFKNKKYSILESELSPEKKEQIESIKQNLKIDFFRAFEIFLRIEKRNKIERIKNRLGYAYKVNQSIINNEFYELDNILKSREIKKKNEQNKKHTEQQIKKITKIDYSEEINQEIDRIKPNFYGNMDLESLKRQSKLIQYFREYIKKLGLESFKQFAKTQTFEKIVHMEKVPLPTDNEKNEKLKLLEEIEKDRYIYDIQKQQPPQELKPLGERNNLKNILNRIKNKGINYANC